MSCRPAWVTVLTFLVGVSLLLGGCTGEVTLAQGPHRPLEPLVATFEWEVAGGPGDGTQRWYLHLAARSWDDWLLLRWPEQEETAEAGTGDTSRRVPVVERWQRPLLLTGDLTGAYRTPRPGGLDAQERLDALDSATGVAPDGELAREYEQDPDLPPVIPHTYVPVRLDDLRSNGASVTPVGRAEADAAGLDSAQALRRSGLDGDEVAYYEIAWTGPRGRRLHIAVMLEPTTGIPLDLVETDHDPDGVTVSRLRLLHLETGVEQGALGLADVP